ncbi:hypothetical protein EVAR_85886_1 [Eumeta japonica]|uniref:Uncharacterized protein n=1 Tax=Eumeta variegata TaxID=151549 RepID=A0A4C2A2G0_EUMVA|nr:hypothetical protein EVAR_85886_1 [Eumeta japonica]
MAYHKDADIIENVLAQNKHLVKDINLKEVTIRVRYRKRARNQLQCHPVLELSPSVHKRFLEAGKLYIDLQKVAVYDQSPLCYCADKTHEWENARRKQNEEPKCKNCWENGIKTEANHEAFSNKCKRSPEIQSSDCRVTPAGDRERDIDSFGSGTLCRKPRHPKQNPGTKVIQCTVGRQKPVKAAIIVLRQSRGLHDPQLVTETESAVLLKIGRMKLGIISIYFEGDEDIEPYIIRTKRLAKIWEQKI